MANKQPTREQIAQLKRRAAPINYSNISVNEMGQLQERAALLDQRIVEGYGCIWGQPNQHGEIVLRGAYAKSIAELGPGSNSNYQIKFRDEHGRACALFEVLKEDEIGLYFKTKPLDPVQWCDDLLVQLRSGTINNFSNGFKYIWDKIEYDSENDLLVITEARLFEISAVAIPSDMNTFAVRTAEEKEFLFDDTEDFILTLPKSMQLDARKLISRYNSLIAVEPLAQRQQHLPKDEPKATGIDYAALRAEISQHSLIL